MLLQKQNTRDQSKHLKIMGWYCRLLSQRPWRPVNFTLCGQVTNYTIRLNNHGGYHDKVWLRNTTAKIHLIIFFFIYSLLMLKNNSIVFPTKLCQILPSLLVWPVYKRYSFLTAISWYPKCGLYTSIYSTYYMTMCDWFCARSIMYLWIIVISRKLPSPHPT